MFNGWNRVVDNNAMKDFAAQVMLKPVDEVTFYLGYTVGAQQPDTVVTTTLTAPAGGGPVTTDVTVARDFPANWRLRHFVDFVADIKPIPTLRLLANADYGTEDMGGNVRAEWYGANLVVSYQVTDQFFVAPRGEIYVDDSFTFGPNVQANAGRRHVDPRLPAIAELRHQAGRPWGLHQSAALPVQDRGSPEQATVHGHPRRRGHHQLSRGPILRWVGTR